MIAVLPWIYVQLVSAKRRNWSYVLELRDVISQGAVTDNNDSRLTLKKIPNEIRMPPSGRDAVPTPKFRRKFCLLLQWPNKISEKSEFHWKVLCQRNVWVADRRIEMLDRRVNEYIMGRSSLLLSVLPLKRKKLLQFHRASFKCCLISFNVRTDKIRIWTQDLASPRTDIVNPEGYVINVRSFFACELMYFWWFWQ